MSGETFRYYPAGYTLTAAGINGNLWIDPLDDPTTSLWYYGRAKTMEQNEIVTKRVSVLNLREGDVIVSPAEYHLASDSHRVLVERKRKKVTLRNLRMDQLRRGDAVKGWGIVTHAEAKHDVTRYETAGLDYTSPALLRRGYDGAEYLVTFHQGTEIRARHYEGDFEVERYED